MYDSNLTESRNISNQLVSFLVGNLPIADFDLWIRQTPELRTILSRKDYDKLLSMSAHHPDAYVLYESILHPYIDWAQYEKEQLAELLMAIIWKDNCVEALLKLRELFLKGYDFLNVLVTEYSLQFINPPGSKARSKSQQEAILTSIYPKLRAEANLVLTQLVSGKITFTGTYSPEGYPEYIEQ